MVAILRDDSPALSTTQKWAAEFRRGRESPEDPSGCPATANIKENINHNDRRLTINQIANVISISHERVENILHNELGMTKVSAWWVSCLLILFQKCTKLITSWKILTLLESDPVGFLEPEKKTIHAMEVPPLHQLQKGQSRFICREDDGPSLLGCKRHCVYWLCSEGSYHSITRVLCKHFEAVTKGEQDQRLVSSGQWSSTHLLVSMAAVCDCSFELVDSPPYSLHLVQSIICSPTWKTHLAGKLVLHWWFFNQQDENFFGNGIWTLQHR